MAADAFYKAFAAEMDAMQHSALVELYTWANRQDYGSDPDLKQRAEAWAKRVEDLGMAMDVLEATTPEPCPTCGHA